MIRDGGIGNGLVTVATLLNVVMEIDNVENKVTVKVVFFKVTDYWYHIVANGLVFFTFTFRDIDDEKIVIRI